MYMRSFVFDLCLNFFYCFLFLFLANGRGNMSNEEEKRCPLCAEEMDWTDQQLKPCKCGYEVCVWCWHQIMDMAEKDATEGRCPACRTPYDKNKIVGMEANFERVVANNSNRKQKPPKAKPKTNEGRKDLSNVRVIQRKMAYIIGLPLSLADEDLLQRKEYFGQYGKVTKVSLSRTAGGTVQQFVNDTCSVYITYSKEEEAVRCIQSVHGYVLDGRFLRASFGTAKYCHAWLRNMPCNNPACLYLHTIGAEEDSFGKDEVAAVHTRNRVQEIVGAAQYLQRRSGSMLPPPVDEHLHNNSASTERSYVNSGLKVEVPDIFGLDSRNILSDAYMVGGQDVAYSTVISNEHLACSKDKDGVVRTPKQMTTFVDIVGRPGSSGPDKDVNLVEDGRIFNLCSDMSSVCIDKNNHVEAANSDSVLQKVSSSGQHCNGLSRNQLFTEPFREPSKLQATEQVDLTHNDACIRKELSCLMLDSGRQVLRNPSSIPRVDSLSFDDPRFKDSVSLSQTSFIPSPYSAKVSEDSRDHTWWHTESRSDNDFSADCNGVNNHVGAAPIHSTSVNSVVLNDGYNEKKFQSSAKSDRIYRSSNSFSNEEIVEHLRRLDGDSLTNHDENSAAVESSIISNILSLDFDASDDSTLPHSVTGLFNGTDGRHGSSWSFHNSDRSGFSFAKQQGFSSQVTDVDSSFSNIGQEMTNFSALHDSGENKEHYLYNKPPYHVPRAQSITPPGFSATSKPPPGFSMGGRSEQLLSASSGSHLMKNSVSNYHYRTPSTGNLSNNSDDLIDPAIMVVGSGKSTNGLNNSSLDMRSSPYASQLSAFEEEARLWNLMQRSASAQQDPKFSQSYLQQAPPSHQEPRYSGLMGDGFSSHDDFYGGVTSRLVDQQQSYNPSSFTQYSQQPKYAANGHISNGYQLRSDEAGQHRSEVGISELQRNERLGYSNKFYPGYNEYMFQMPSSGDVYTRVFGM